MLLEDVMGMERGMFAAPHTVDVRKRGHPVPIFDFVPLLFYVVTC